MSNELPEEDSTGILVHASKLRKSNSQKKELRDYVVDIARKLNDEIKTGHNMGDHHINTSLPITFNVTNMSNSDSQRIIWFTLLKWLNNKTYITKIKVSDTKCLLTISWISEEEAEHINYQKQFIAQCSI
jgi:hypothetical protein